MDFSKGRQKDIFQGENNSGKISFCQLETKAKKLFTKMLIGKYQFLKSKETETPLLRLWLCSGHTSATTWNSAKSEGTASDEYAWCESRNSKCLDQKWRGKRFFGQIG